MLEGKEFIQKSLELNLFFGRIMKEHMTFIQVSLPIKNSNYILEADELKRSFEGVLFETVEVANGAIAKESIDSNELVTPFTLDAERILEDLTGVCINKDLTLAELQLVSNPDFKFTPSLENYVFDLNNRYINLMQETIDFKERLSTQFRDCDIFMFIYPSMLHHLIEEGQFYLNTLFRLQERRKITENMLKKEIFWDEIMGEHAQYIRGLLDPSEKKLFQVADSFAELFEKLLKETKETDKKDICKITKKNFQATKEIKEFKGDSTEGIIQCKIKSIINPLLADHTLREANRYLRVLREYLKKC